MQKTRLEGFVLNDRIVPSQNDSGYDETILKGRKITGDKKPVSALPVKWLGID